MTPLELCTRFRLNVADTQAPYLWTDGEVYSYLDAAQQMFYRLTQGIADVVIVPFSAGGAFVTISDRILKIRRAALASDGRPLRIANFEQLETEAYDSDYGTSSAWSPLQIDASPGQVKTIVLGMAEHKIRLVQVPAVDDTLELVVERTPLADITSASLTFEAPSAHHLYFLLWVEHLAYSKQDAETVDRTKADARKLAFESYCAMSIAEKNRRRHVPRAIAYGGL